MASDFRPSQRLARAVRGAAQHGTASDCWDDLANPDATERVPPGWRSTSACRLLVASLRAGL